ncbi:patatin-like phospholipase family protein [Roseivirga pacifica]|uniref:patatin-like phospholipase family protein n=1 Tax=Roseivirga pacifica TaxID=1267423 RepID=UPI003BAD9645
MEFSLQVDIFDSTEYANMLANSIRFTALFLTLLFISGLSIAQNSAPKVGLVLSGGGARGMAHIGVLKKMEEAGIYPDYVTGTSMGAVVGALYSLGYSAHEIDSIAKTADWSMLLSNDISFQDVAIEEKDYFGRYILELPMKGTSPQLPKGIIGGQNLYKLFSTLTRGSHGLTSFDELPIPYRAVATDIETGKSVTLSDGSLTEAMRASMAIPSVFTPVEIDGKLLVDGGLVRNFPVQEVIDMGADIVIGVFVSTDLDKKEDLSTMVDILFQSSWVLSAYDSRAQTELVDLYLEPDLDGYSASDFTSSDSIIHRGELIGEKMKPQLDRLYDSLTNLGKQFKTPQKLIAQQQYDFSEIEVVGNQDISKQFILGRLGFDDSEPVSLAQIDEAINQVYGTQYFAKVDFEILPLANNTYDLRIKVEEKPAVFLKGALHYNNEVKAGINLNVTARNTFMKNSRLLFEFDLAENFRADINLLKYLGKRQRTAINAGYNALKSEIPLYDEGNEIATLSSVRNDPYISFQTTHNSKATIGTRLDYFINRAKPKVSESLNVIKKITNETAMLSVFAKRNTLNKAVLPTAGFNLSFEAGYAFENITDFELTVDTTPEIEESIRNTLATESYWHFRLKADWYLPISHRSNFILKGELSYADTEDSGLNREIGIGGFYNNYPFTTAFWGANFYQFQVSNYALGQFGFQTEPIDKLVLMFMLNYVDSSAPSSLIDPNHEDSNIFYGATNLIGGGIGIGFKSILGPVFLNLGKTERTGQWTTGINIGYWY